MGNVGSIPGLRRSTRGRPGKPESYLKYSTVQHIKMASEKLETREVVNKAQSLFTLIIAS